METDGMEKLRGLVKRFKPEYLEYEKKRYWESGNCAAVVFEETSEWYRDRKWEEEEYRDDPGFASFHGKYYSFNEGYLKNLEEDFKKALNKIGRENRSRVKEDVNTDMDDFSVTFKACLE